jgi:hypothetical protein
MGYVNPVTVTVPGISAGARATLAMRAFSDALAGCFAIDGPFTVTLGGEGIPPANLIGLRRVNFAPGLECIPEPSAFVLGLLGAGLIILFRQKPNGLADREGRSRNEIAPSSQRH